jgi:hypothetical protein
MAASQEVATGTCGTPLHPENRHVPDKIRQQLQVLRDLGRWNLSARGAPGSGGINW